MSTKLPTQLPGERVKKAIQEFSELREQHPHKSRNQLLQQVVLKFDLSPKECDFLERQFCKE